jgi:hypothetical protein
MFDCRSAQHCNHRRLLDPIGHIAPVEFDGAYWKDEYTDDLRHPDPSLGGPGPVHSLGGRSVRRTRV